MQIVIDIPDHLYNVIKNKECTNKNVLTKAVENGTPLPKNHGEIIDYGYVVDAIDDWVNAEEYKYTNATDYLRKRVANTPTIIPADAERSDTE